MKTAIKSFLLTFAVVCASIAFSQVTLAAPSYNLTATTPVNGSIASSGGSGLDLQCGVVRCSVAKTSGDVVTVVAVPVAGYGFSSWDATGACSGQGQTCTVTMTAVKNIGVANFVYLFTAPEILQATKPLNGSISSSGGHGGNLNCGVTACSVTKEHNDSVTVTANPDAGYVFSSWAVAGACNGQGNPCTVVMSSFKSVGTVNFIVAPVTFNLSVNKAGTGTVIGGAINCGGTCSASVASGTTVSLIATADVGYTFSSWTGCDNVVANNCVVTMTADRSPTVNFVVGVPPVIPSSGDPLNPCWDILYNGQAVLVNGVPNSGVMQFDPTGGLPAPAQEACMWAPDNDAYTIIYGKGWLWDTNLGWISMYCDDEDGDGVDPLVDPTKPYTNQGIACGSYKYGVWMEGYSQANRGRLHGFAWGDNVGYISFNCMETGTCGPASYYVQPDVTFDPWNPASICTGYVDKAGCDPVSLGAGVSHAWSDNVGWLNLKGVRFPWFQVIDATVLVTLNIDPDPATLTKNSARIADGDSSFTMNVMMKKMDGNPIDPTKYDISFTPTWSKDSVTYNQTSSSSVDCKSSPQGGNCAVSKPLSETDFGGVPGGYGAVVGMAFTGYVKSFAPTTSMNGLDADSNGSVDFSYEDFPVLPSGVVKPPTHELILGNVQASVLRTADGLCSFGTIGGGACNLKNVSTGGQNFGFKPAIEVTDIEDSLNGETIAASYLVPNNLTYSTQCLGLLAGLGACGGSGVDFKTSIVSQYIKMVFNDDSAGDPATEGSECNDPSSVSIPSLLSWGNGFFAFTPVFTNDPAVPGACLSNAPATTKDPTIYSVVTQKNSTGSDSIYYSNKLPRKTGALIYNPVADVKGSVYSTGVSNPQTGSAYRSLGDISTNVLREQIARNVYNLIGGVKATAGGGGKVTITGFSATDGFVGTGGENLSKLQKDEAGVPKLYYTNGNDVIFENPAGPTIAWTGERTLIVIGADVYINSNLYVSAGSVSPKPKLGIIVLKDEQFQKGGNIYIAPNVTNIQANIYADGSVFSYGPAVPPFTSINANGEPYFTDENGRRTVLINQLFIEGSLASQNTIGGAVYTPSPVLGDGSLESADEGNYGATPKGRSRARLYDLNFLRYFGLVYGRMPAGSGCEGEAVDQQNPTYCPTTLGYNITNEPAPTGDLIPNPAGIQAEGLGTGKYSAEYILFDPPTATLPGFGVSTGAEVKIGPQ
jgi:hypothetical protein